MSSSNFVISEYLYSPCSLRTNSTKSERFCWARLDWHETLFRTISVPLDITANIQFSYDRNARTFSHRAARREYPPDPKTDIRPYVSSTLINISYRRPTLTYTRASLLPIIEWPYRTVLRWSSAIIIIIIM